LNQVWISGRTRYGPDEGHDLQAVGLGIRQRVGAGVGTAGREDTGHAILLEQRQHLIELVERFWLPVVVQMGVEYFDRLIRDGAVAGGNQCKDGHDCDAPEQ
jgi:hypothetical protein